MNFHNGHNIHNGKQIKHGIAEQIQYSKSSRK